MGNSPPPKRFDPKSEKQKFEITCIKVRSYLELQRDRRQNSANAKEKALIQMFTSPTRSKPDEVQKASSIISDLQYVKACNIVIRYCDILKENSLRVVEAKGAPAKVDNLMQYIESVSWSAKPLNLSCIVEFQNQMIYFFGSDISESIQKSAKVDPDLKACFKDLLPTPLDINNYIVNLSNKTGLALSQINACGHEFAPGGFGGGDNGSGGQYAQFQMPQQQIPFGQEQNYGPPMHFNEQPPQLYGQNPSFGTFQQYQPPQQQYQPPPQQFQPPPQQFQTQPQQFQPSPQQFMYQPPPQQFGGFQNQGPPPEFHPSAGFGGTNNAPANNQGYPEFGAVNIPKNNAAVGGGQQPPAQGGNQLPNLDDFEERMRKLRENL